MDHADLDPLLSLCGSKMWPTICGLSVLLAPPPLRHAAQWADDNRILPPGSAEPGPFRSARTPYMIPVATAFSDPHYRRVVMVCASQMGKTDLALNVIGHRLDDAPTPIMYVGPSMSFVETKFDPRLMEMLRSTPTLWDRLLKGKACRKTLKHIGGADLNLAWAGSATEMASFPAALALIDELDRMELDVEGEGSPVGLVEARGNTYPDFKLGVFSTPLIGNVEAVVHETTGLVHWMVGEASDLESPTWRLWQEGTRQEWAWPCVDCGDYFIPRFALLKWPEKSTPIQALRGARLMCPHCGSLISDARKSEMNGRGRMVAPGQSVDHDGVVSGGLPDADSASFWISGLCSPWVTWGRLAKNFVEATHAGDPGRIQTVVNTGFGELFKIGAGQARSPELLGDRLRRPYRFDQVPAGATSLVCGVDVQKNRLVYVLRAFGYRMESWLIRHGEIFGETEHATVWGDLAHLLDNDFGGFSVKMCLVDSGYRPGERFKTPDNMVYEFARLHGVRVRATKGHDRQNKPIQPNDIDITFRGRLIKNGLKLWNLDSDYFKSWVVQRFDWPEGEPGGWHVSQDADDDYFRQISAEVRTVKPSGASVWVRVRPDNHYLDCEALCVAAAQMLGIHLMKAPPVQDGSAKKSVGAQLL